MGVNGITEAFVNGNLDSKEMASYRKKLIMITINYM